MTEIQPQPLATKRIVVRRILGAPRAEVYDAWLDVDSLKRFMTPGPCRGASVEVDPRVGGAFRIVMHGDSVDYDHTGEYVVLERPAKLAFTWISQGTHGTKTLVTVELFDAGKSKTELVLTHEDLPVATADNHAKGWGEIVDDLVKMLTARAA